MVLVTHLGTLLVIANCLRDKGQNVNERGIGYSDDDDPVS